MSTVNREIAVQPLNEPACPACGGPNGCAVAASGRFEVDCWCKTATFSAELLARVPDHRKNKACICRACAQAVSGPRTDPDNPAGAADVEMTGS